MTQGEVIALIKAFGGSSGGGGGGSALLTLEMDEGTGALNKTWQEIERAAFAVIKISPSVAFITGITDSDADDKHAVYFAIIDSEGAISPATFLCDSAFDYPTLAQ